MAQKIKLGDNEYDAANLSDQGRAVLNLFQFSTQKLQELNNMQALLQRAKNSYIESLKQEILSQKAGYLLDDQNRIIIMPKITIDEIEYNTEDLSDNGKAQLASLQFLEVQMKKLKSEIAVYQTARNSYLAALKSELEK